MNSNDLIEYTRRASELGTCWAQLERIRRQSECLAGQVRQSKSSLKAAMLVPALIRPAQASAICDQNSLEASYRTTYLSCQRRFRPVRPGIDEVPEGVTRFLELLQQAMESEPALFKLSIMES
jgi:hypothetical protein